MLSRGALMTLANMRRSIPVRCVVETGRTRAASYRPDTETAPAFLHCRIFGRKTGVHFPENALKRPASGLFGQLAIVLSQTEQRLFQFLIALSGCLLLKLLCTVQKNPSLLKRCVHVNPARTKMDPFAAR
jgi:hypothetical protein